MSAFVEQAQRSQRRFSLSRKRRAPRRDERDSHRGEANAEHDRGAPAVRVDEPAAGDRPSRETRRHGSSEPREGLGHRPERGDAADDPVGGGDHRGDREPGDEEEIKNFCSINFDVTFPMFAKIDVNGEQAHPLWKWLKQEKSGLLGIGAIKWNFSKFLVGRDGKVLKRFAPTDKPESLAADIESALG